MTEEKRRRLTGRKAPSFSLPVAIEMAERIRSAIGRSPAARELIAKALGHQTAQSGAASVKIGTLTHFGLLDRAGREKYALSPLGTSILYPHDEAEKAVAIAQAAKSPTLHRDLIDRFVGHALPTLLPNILAREFHVADKKTHEAAAIFEESMTYAGLLKHGVLLAEPEYEPNIGDSQERNAVPGNSQPVTIGVIRDPGRALDGESHSNRTAELSYEGSTDNEYQIVLSGNRFAYLRLPEQFSASDLEKVEKWINFNREDLVKKMATDG